MSTLKRIQQPHITLTPATHREIRIAATFRNQTALEVVERAWIHMKAAEGKTLHKPQVKANA